VSWDDVIGELAKYKQIDTAVEPLSDGRCPVCEHYVRKDEKFCPECGQRMKWSKSK
jgi:rRNA maturation endonuclease Nob1